MTGTGVSSLASRLLIYFFVSATMIFDNSSTAIKFGMAISAFSVSAMSHTRSRATTGAIAATAI